MCAVSETQLSGLSLLFGASRESGDVVVTFTRVPGDSALEEVEEKFWKSR